MAIGVDVTSSPPAATSFSTTFSAWSNGGHSDFWHSCKIRWAPSLMDEPGLGRVVGTVPSANVQNVGFVYEYINVQYNNM